MKIKNLLLILLLLSVLSKGHIVESKQVSIRNNFSRSYVAEESLDSSIEEDHSDSEITQEITEKLSLEDALKKYFQEETSDKIAKSYYELGQKIGRQWIINYEKEFLNASFDVEKEFYDCLGFISEHLNHLTYYQIDEVELGILEGLRGEIDKTSIENIENEVLRRLNSKRSHNKIGVEGGIILSEDKVLTLNIPLGCFYEDVDIIIDEEFNEFYHDHQYGKTITKPYNISIEHNLPLSDSIIDIVFATNKGDNKAVARMINDKLSILPSIYENNELVVKEHLSAFSSEPSYFLIETSSSLKLKDIEDSVFQKEILFLNRANIISGYEDYTFKPKEKISRIEFLTLLGKSMDWPENYTLPHFFNDHDMIHYSKSYVAYALEHGIIKGDENKNFLPNDYITYAHGISMINRLGLGTINPKYVEDNWVNHRLYDSELYESQNNHLKREEMAFFIYHLNNNSINDI